MLNLIKLFIWNLIKKGRGHKTWNEDIWLNLTEIEKLLGEENYVASIGTQAYSWLYTQGPI